MKRGGLLSITTRIIWISLTLISLLWRTTPTFADQPENTLTINAPETDSFPVVRFTLDAYDAQGKFIDHLQPEQIQIQEDGKNHPVQSIQPIQTGIQIILALNVNPAMLNQVDGVSGYQRIQTTLVDWANAQPQNTFDDFSFSTPTGLKVIQETNPKSWAKALSNYQIDLGHAQPSLTSLAEALDLVSDPLERQAVKRSVLYITPPLPAADLTTLNDLTERATKIGVPVNVWQIGGAQVDSVKATDPLQKLANATGGRYNLINLTTGPLPEINSLFEELRKAYQVEYTSSIQKSGSHKLVVKLSQSGQESASPAASFSVTVQPPNPIFLSPPADIHRTWDMTGASKLPVLNPDQVPLKILIEFPDEHPRSIKATRLYVNDKLVQENTKAPFDQFQWSIQNLETSAKHTLRVEVVDSLNLSGSSIETPVNLTVDQPAQTTLVKQPSQSGLIAVAAAVFAGLSLAAILTGNRRRFAHKKQNHPKGRKNDPLSQPVVIAQESALPRSPGSEGRALPDWSRLDGQNAPARLVCLDEHEQPITGGAILLTRQETTFGTNPLRATQVVSSPTVNDLHARLYRDKDNQFYLADQGSIAGTWINYAPVTTRGARLEHGDLVHIGKVMFRFELADPSQLPVKEIKVIHLDVER
jgi:hypothetical protein